MYVSTCWDLNLSIENASYGNQISSTDLPNKKIILPINEEDKPDWQFMENYTKYIFKDKKLKYKDYITKSLLMRLVKNCLSIKSDGDGIPFICIIFIFLFF
jgi:hypothetical protein